MRKRKGKEKKKKEEIPHSFQWGKHTFIWGGAFPTQNRLLNNGNDLKRGERKEGLNIVMKDKKCHKSIKCSARSSGVWIKRERE